MIERWRGKVVWRTPEEVERHANYLKDRALLGLTVTTTTRHGTRRHTCTVIAVARPSACVDFVHHRGCRPWGIEWSSALSRIRWENAQHREGGHSLYLRIDDSTAPNMIGRYLSRDRRSVRSL